VAGSRSCSLTAVSTRITDRCATSYLEVLDAETRLFDAELLLAEARRAELSAFVEVYRALGGGWQQEGRPGH
jgi:outer membrane protein TolC